MSWYLKGDRSIQRSSMYYEGIVDALSSPRNLCLHMVVDAVPPCLGTPPFPPPMDDRVGA